MSYGVLFSYFIILSRLDAPKEIVIVRKNTDFGPLAAYFGQNGWEPGKNLELILKYENIPTYTEPLAAC